jgi:hypothetical protein
MEDVVDLLQLEGDEGLITLLLQLWFLHNISVSEFELKSAYEFEFFLSELLEGLMPIVV